MVKRIIGKDKTPEQVAAFLNTPVMVVVGRGKLDGEMYGLELEVEGANVQMGGKAVKGWRQVAEGSLRGESIEYTFSSPCKYEEAIARVNRLFEAFSATDVRLKNSYRCSTHVHLNFGGQKIKHVVNFFTLYTIVEQLLEEYCGEMRRGNVFCLSNRDAEPIVDYLEDALLRHLNLASFGDGLRYCGLNLCALNKFGSIEIRTMRGADNAQMVIDWIDILRNLFLFTEKMGPPAELMEQISLLGVDDWLRHVFSEDNYKKLMATWPPGRNLQASIYEGLRLVQVLAYRVDEAFRIEVSEEDLKRGKGKKHKELTIIDDRSGLRFNVPHGYVQGSRVQMIAPRVIVYEEFDDTWYEIIDNRGNGLIRPKPWRWVDSFIEERHLRDIDELLDDNDDDDEEWRHEEPFDDDEEI